MGFVLEPITIAAIASGGTAVIVLLVSGVVLLYQRIRVRRGLAASSLPRTSSVTSTPIRQKSFNPYAAGIFKSPSTASSSLPPVSAASAPLAPSHRRNIDAAIAPSPSSASTTLLGSPASKLLPLTKLKKLDRSPIASPESRGRAKLAPIAPHTPPAPAAVPVSGNDIGRRTSTASSMMVITYEQGLANLGLTSSPAPNATRTDTIASDSTTSSQGVPIYSPFQAHPYGRDASPIPSPQPAKAKPAQRPKLGSGRKMKGMEEDKGYFAPRTAESVETGRSSGSARGGGRAGIGLSRIGPPQSSWGQIDWDRNLPSVGVGTGRRMPDGPQSAWLPSYYMPAADRYMPPVTPGTGMIGSKAKWGGRL